MRETWYKLEDGSVVPPAEVAPDASGRLMHESGVAVAMRGPVPHTWSVDPDEEAAKSGRPATGKAMAAEDSRRGGYKTRTMKAR